MDNTIVISTPPHIKSTRTTKSIMIDVLIALIPCAIAGIVFFGLNAFITEITAIAFAIATEYVYYVIERGALKNKFQNFAKISKEFWHNFDYTSAITGLILALILPPTVKWYEVAIGSVLAIALVKMVFGGTGKNLVNPAATGRVMMFLSFSLTTFVACNFGPLSADSEIFTGATHLSGFLLGGNEGAQINILDLFIGTGVAGCIGETCKIAILIGYVYLIVRRVIKWWQPLLLVGISAILSTALATINSSVFDFTLIPSFALSGGLMFCAVFMATDYVTTPKGTMGQVVFIAGLAILTSLLRYFTKIEVISFTIMIMNLLVPLIDRYIIRKPFGYKKTKAVKQNEN